jgi:hypothetical protein
MEAILVTLIGFVSCAALAPLVTWKRRGSLIEARLNGGLQQYVSFCREEAGLIDLATIGAEHMVVNKATGY